LFKSGKHCLGNWIKKKVTGENSLLPAFFIGIKTRQGKDERRQRYGRNMKVGSMKEK